MSRAMRGGLGKQPGAAGAAFRKSVQASRAKETARLGKMMKSPKYQAAAAAKRTADKARAAKTRAARAQKQTAAQKTKQVKADLERQTGAAKAKAAATPKPAAAMGAKAEGVTLKGAYGKMRDQGWGALSGPEKQKLINAGLAGVAGHRVLTGKGVLTGGEGII